MILTTENILLVISVLLFLSIVAGQSFNRFGVPALLFFILVGMLAGEDGPGGIVFDSPRIAQFMGIVALNVILFAGGLETKWKQVKPIATQGLYLATVGVLITAFSIGIFVHFLTDFTWVESLLLGSIVSSTDAAAVFSVLRTNRMKLCHRAKPLLELESGSNDPMAYLLTIFFLGMLKEDGHSLWSLIPAMFLQMGLGVLLGFVMGRVQAWVLRKLKSSYEGLYPVLALSMMYFTYSFTDLLGGNGFLAVYISGLLVANSRILHRQSIVQFFDGMAWLMQLLLFLCLGLLVNPSEIVPYIGIGLLISVFMILVARPVSVWISLWLSRSKLNVKTRIFVSWVGLRGAAPIVFATYPLIAGATQSNMIFNLVFFISMTSVLIQGSTIPWMARKLKVAVPEPKFIIGKKDIDSKTEIVEIRVDQDSPYLNQTLSEIKFPLDTRITMIRRKGEYMVPKGDLKITVDDHVYLISKNPELLGTTED